MGKKLVPPEGGWGWMVVLGVSLVNLSTRPIEPSFGLLFGDLLRDLDVGTTGAGVIVSSYEAIINFSGLLVGPLIKSYSYRKVALIGSFLCALGLMSTFPARTMAHILCTYSIITGLGVGFSSSATFVSLNYYFKKKRGTAVGLTMLGTGLGLLAMPQAVRYLTEEFHFQGAVLILGAFALNACVGAILLQPIKWHLKEVIDEEEPCLVPSITDNNLTQKDESLLLNQGGTDRKTSFCPQITISQVIQEHDEEDEDNEEDIGEKKITPQPQPKKSEIRQHSERPKLYLKTERKYSLIERGDKYQQESPTHEGRKFSLNTILNKSSTEPKFDKYFEENKLRLHTHAECDKYDSSALSITSINSKSEKNNFTSQFFITPSTTAVRKRRSSTISNLSNLDFHGSCLHIHAIEAEHKETKTSKQKNLKNEKKTTNENKSFWSRFASFMDLDLLKDPIYLNILLGLSIFYIAEFNFKMIVPFYLANLGHSKSETAFCLSMMAVSDIVARLVLPPICDRLKISRRTMFMIAAFFLALSRSTMAESGEWIQLETTLIISGFWRGATLINFMLVISEYCENFMDKLPAAFGIHMVAKGIFIVAFGPLIGFIRDVTQSYPLCIHAQSVMILLCILAWGTEYIIVYISSKKDKEKKIPAS